MTLGLIDINSGNIKSLEAAINKSNIRCSAKIRSTQKESSGFLSITENSAIFKFDDEILTTAPGQACVFYFKDNLGEINLPLPNLVGDFQISNVSTAIAVTRNLNQFQIIHYLEMKYLIIIFQLNI